MAWRTPSGISVTQPPLLSDAAAASVGVNTAAASVGVNTAAASVGVNTAAASFFVNTAAELPEVAGRSDMRADGKGSQALYTRLLFW
jgi:hypothetical protein